MDTVLTNSGEKYLIGSGKLKYDFKKMFKPFWSDLDKK